MSIALEPHRRLVVAAALAGSIVTAGATAQQRMVVMERDSGSGPQVMHLSMPDMGRLRLPDYVRSDIPVFEDRLRLEEPQMESVTERLERYLEEFNALAVEILPPQSNRMVFDAGQNEGAIDFAFTPSGPGGWVGAEDLPEGSSVAVGIQMTAGGDVTGEDVDVMAGGGGGGSGVFVTVDSADGEIPDDVRERLEARAAEMAEQLREQMESGEGNFQMDPAAIEASMAEHAAQMEELAEAARKFETEKDALRKAFEMDVQAALLPEQLERWPALQRTLVRLKTLPQGQLSGESADLIAILEDLGVDIETAGAVAEQALAYELALHDALVRRNAYVADANRKVDEAMSNGDGQTALELVERGADYRVAVRDVNKRYAATLAAVLGDRAEEFNDQARRALWSRVYSRTRAERAFAQARQLEGLAEDQLLQILELEYVFRSELERINADLVRTIDREEPVERVRTMERVAEAMGGSGNVFLDGGDDDPVRTAFSERRAFERRSMKQLYATLTPEQVESLPALPPEHDEPFMIRFGPAGEDN